MLFFIFGGPLADSAIAFIARRGTQPLFSISSPGYLFRIAGGWGRTLFWPGLAATQAIAWLLFASGVSLDSAHLATKGRKKCDRSKEPVLRLEIRQDETSNETPNKLLPLNPVLWLASRERWQLAGMWVIALLATGVLALLVIETPNSAWMMLTYPVGFFMLLLYLGAASQSSRFFVEARRSGLIELLLATPLSERNIVLGQWRALLRTFAIPVCIVLALQLISFRTLSPLLCGAPWLLPPQPPPLLRVPLPPRTLAAVLTLSSHKGRSKCLHSLRGSLNRPGMDNNNRYFARHFGNEHSKPYRPMLVWHVDGDDLQKRKPRGTEDHSFCPNRSLHCDQLWLLDGNRPFTNALSLEKRGLLFHCVYGLVSS